MRRKKVSISVWAFYVPAIVVSELFILIHLVLIEPCQVGTVTISMLWVRKLRHSKFTSLLSFI